MSRIKSLLPITLSLFLLLVYSCKDEPVKPPVEEKPEISVLVEEVTCTFAWVRLKTTLPSELKLFRNDSLILQVNSSVLDTLIFDEGLLPGQFYKYKLEAFYNNKTYQTESLTRSLDTTSHNFSWQVLTFGEHSHSILRDVAIIDENDIWAVGEIYLNDSLGNPEHRPYTAVHWNGAKWEYKRVTVLHNSDSIVPPLYAIKAFSHNEIWLSSGVPVKGDGYKWTQYHLFDMGILSQQDGALTSIWGSTNDLFYSGGLGTIAHYNGTNWTKIESGTTVDLHDIYGSPDGKVIWATGNRGTTPDKTVLLKIENSNVTKIFDGSAFDINLGVLESVWSNSDKGVYYLSAGKGRILYQRNNLSAINQHVMADGITVYMRRIRGIAANDIFCVGEEGNIGHFNGIRYNTKYSIPIQNLSFLYSLDKKNNILAAVGTWYQGVADSKAVVIIGKD